MEAAAEHLHRTSPHPRSGRRQTGVGNGRERDVADVPPFRRIKERLKESRWLMNAFGIFAFQEVFENGRDSAVRTVPSGERNRAENDYEF